MCLAWSHCCHRNVCLLIALWGRKRVHLPLLFLPLQCINSITLHPPSSFSLSSVAISFLFFSSSDALTLSIHFISLQFFRRHFASSSPVAHPPCHRALRRKRFQASHEVTECAHRRDAPSARRSRVIKFSEETNICSLCISDITQDWCCERRTAFHTCHHTESHAADTCRNTAHASDTQIQPCDILRGCCPLHDPDAQAVALVAPLRIMKSWVLSVL